MDTSTWVMMALAVATLIVVYIKSPEAAHKGINATGSLILEITPRMIAAFFAGRPDARPSCRRRSSFAGWGMARGSKAF